MKCYKHISLKKIIQSKKKEAIFMKIIEEKEKKYN